MVNAYLQRRIPTLHRTYDHAEARSSRVSIGRFTFTFRSRSVTAAAIGFGCWVRTVRQLRLAAITARRSSQSVRTTWGPADTGHAISFWTWRSLCLDHGLTDTEAVDAMTSMILATTTVPQAQPVH